jgi:UV DNA damage endonuclease
MAGDRMLVRFGYVAMSVFLENASPSRTMTATNFRKLEDREAAIRRLEWLAAENIHNCLRLLRHNVGHEIHLFRFSSKIIPLYGHEMLRGWDPFPALAPAFAELGDYVKKHDMRVSFHPDHFTVLSTPRAEVLASSLLTLDYHVRMLEAMGLDDRARLNIHIGGTYGDREKALVRFCDQFNAMDERLRRRITLENDDKTYMALETLQVCEQLGVPMVLDLHHHIVNGNGDSATQLWPRILDTWSNSPYVPDKLPPKIHISSPKSEHDPRAHADYVELSDILPFLRDVAAMTPQLDVMIEAKRKDDALFRLMDDLKGADGIELIDQSSVLVRG